MKLTEDITVKKWINNIENGLDRNLSEDEILVLKNYSKIYHKIWPKCPPLDSAERFLKYYEIKNDSEILDIEDRINKILHSSTDLSFGADCEGRTAAELREKTVEEWNEWKSGMTECAELLERYRCLVNKKCEMVMNKCKLVMNE